MLLQSHARDAGVPVIHLLPALPKAWPSGDVTGLRAQGGFEVSLRWKDGTLLQARIHSMLGGPAVVRFGSRQVPLDTRAGGEVVLDQQLTVVARD